MTPVTTLMQTEVEIERPDDDGDGMPPGLAGLLGGLGGGGDARDAIRQLEQMRDMMESGDGPSPEQVAGLLDGMPSGLRDLLGVCSCAFT